MVRHFLLGSFIMLTAAPAMGAGRYSADRYDSRVEVQPNGSIRVTETISIRFETGSFSQFYRAIPRRMNDGIEIVSASMDGTPMPTGDGPNHVQISGSSNVRVTWRFAVTAPATHIFAVTYLAQGTVRQEEDADVIAWTLLPTEHSYRIASSTSDITLTEAPSSPPSVDVRRVGESTLDVDGRQVRIDASDIRANGWLQVWIRVAPGTLVSTAPRWQQRQLEISRLSIRWVYAAAIVFLSGLAALFFVRQRYDPPPHEAGATTQWSTAAPDTLAPSIAGTLLTNGSPRLEQAMAAVFALADRGELRIDEQSRALGLRDFTMTATPTRRPLAPYEQSLLEIVFAETPDPGASVTLGKARNRLVRHFRRFRTPLQSAMAAAGLLDDDRRAVRNLFLAIAVVCLIGAGLLSIGFALLVDRFGGWPMMIPLALALVGVTGLICYAAHTPLSNEGVRRASEWRGFRRYLRDVARDRQPSPGDAVLKQLLPFAVALGIAHVWSSHLKRHRSAAPAWFRAASDARHNGAVAFSAFVASGGSGAGGSHGGASAAAGGGASGAS
jgi:uncharacterized membrane protein YuzA (DUF378 family)